MRVADRRSMYVLYSTLPLKGDLLLTCLFNKKIFLALFFMFETKRDKIQGPVVSKENGDRQSSSWTKTLDYLGTYYCNHCTPVSGPT
jgi:hypothetical protein